MLTLLAIPIAILGVYVTAYVLYQLLFFVANAVIAEEPHVEPARKRRFVMLVPAHNEEILLPRLLESLRVQEYPANCHRAVVIADNCNDGTAVGARAFDVDVLERSDKTQRGKGYAIRFALERIDLDRYDALVILDSDSVVNPGFLKHLNAQLERGHRVIQSSNGVANPQHSWFTRLVDVSETIANEILSPGKEKLGLSGYLLGNGMCFDVQVLKSHPWDAFSVAEDWEYYARLITSGVYVGYSRLSRQTHEESVNLEQASSQRIRWSSGRFQVLRRYGPAMLMRGVRTRSIKCIDACLPLVLPNPSLGMSLTVVGFFLGALYWLLGGGSVWVALYAALGLIQLGMFLIGVLYTEHKAANALSLVVAPVFLAWKFSIDLLSLFGFGAKEWKRTERRLS